MKEEKKNIKKSSNRYRQQIYVQLISLVDIERFTNSRFFIIIDEVDGGVDRHASYSYVQLERTKEKTF